MSVFPIFTWIHRNKGEPRHGVFYVWKHNKTTLWKQFSVEVKYQAGGQAQPGQGQPSAMGSPSSVPTALVNYSIY